MRPFPSDLARRLENGGRDLNVLVVRFGAFGDILRTLPAVRLVRSGLPEARISWALDENWSAILAGHPDIDDTVPFPRSRMAHERRSPARWPALLRSLAGWRRALRDVRADLALDFHGNLRSGVSAWLAGAEVRLGYDGHQQKEGNRLFTTHRVASGERRTPRIERNLDLVRALGLPAGPLPDGGLPIGPDAIEAARRAVGPDAEAGVPYAVLSPGASRRQAYKKPPTGLLAAAADFLAERGIVSMVVYGPGEEADAARVVRAAEGGARLAPPTDLWTLAAMVRGARVFVGGDTGPLHLACAVGCPALGIYGPTDPKVNTPWGVPHEVVHPDVAYTGIKRRDRTLGSFEGITREAVRAALASLVGRTETETAQTPGPGG